MLVGDLSISSRRIWWMALAASAVLLGVVIAQIDLPVALQIWRNINAAWIAVGIGLLLLEGGITALRLRLLARRSVSFRQCMEATAWYVLLLIGLPARLGELAGIGAITRCMHERTGAAAASLLIQRLFDLALLLCIVIIIVLRGETRAGTNLILLVGVGLTIALLVAFLNLPRMLAAVAQRLRPRRHERWPRRVLRALLQARMVFRHHLNRGRILSLAALTMAKWFVNLSGVACVVVAVLPLLPLSSAYAIGVIYNLSAVIPIQTVGGFGVSEVVLLGSFTWLGHSLATGASVAIAIRLALLSAPVLFWAMVIAPRLLTHRLGDHASAT